MTNGHKSGSRSIMDRTAIFHAMRGFTSHLSIGSRRSQHTALETITAISWSLVSRALRGSQLRSSKRMKSGRPRSRIQCTRFGRSSSIRLVFVHVIRHYKASVLLSSEGQDLTYFAYLESEYFFPWVSERPTSIADNPSTNAQVE